MNSFFTALVNSIPVFFTIASTLVLRKVGVFNEKMREGIKPLLFKLILPIFAFNVLFGLKIDSGKLDLIFYSIIFEVILLASIGLLHLIFKFERKTFGTLLIIMLTFGVGSFAYPFIKLNFDENVFADVVVVDITLFVITLIFGPVIGSAFNSKRGLVISTIKSIITDPVLISVALALTLTAIGVELPVFVHNTLDFVSTGFVFLVLVYLSLSLKRPNLSQLLNLTMITLFRIIVAALFIFVLIMLTDKTLQGLKALPLALITPFSSFGLIYSEEYNLNPEKAAQLAIFSIILLIFLYPIVISLLL